MLMLTLALASGVDFDSTLATIIWLVELAGILIGALAMLRRAFAAGEELDLRKTLEAARDAGARLNDHIKTMPPELREQIDDVTSAAHKAFVREHVAKAVKHVEAVRGKTLPAKLVRKARDRILATIDLPTPFSDDW